MDNYIGCKLVKAQLAYKITTDYGTCGVETKIYPAIEPIPKAELGYKVVYTDGYESWSPKEAFEKAYIKVGDNNTITQENVDNFIKSKEVSTIGDKTTLVRVTLVNGFEIIETSSCVDPVNYDEALGADICMKKIKDKIWFLLGFFLQTAIGGVK